VAFALRILLFLIVLLLAYYGWRYLTHPKRKLELAQEKHRTYLLDDAGNVRKNFLLTHKGALFEGEKHLGMTDEAFRITRIFIWVRDPAQLHGLSKDDFYELEQLILERYPAAIIEWKSPIREFIKR
jgi:hypothetical protein